MQSLRRFRPIRSLQKSNKKAMEASPAATLFPLAVVDSWCTK
jgi:hypothetical protein